MSRERDKRRAQRPICLEKKDFKVRYLNSVERRKLCRDCARDLHFVEAP